jgi:ribosomal protein L11 methyltransferase
MLRPPHTRYGRLHVYYLDRREIPPVRDEDYIGTWIEDDRAILFFHRAKEELVSSLCRSAGATVIYKADLDYRDWEAGTAVHSFATESLAVTPVWERHRETECGRRRILLDPSVVFGSGFHATTRLCLETLERLLPGSTMETVLDLGTGTGLLAIAAAWLGAEKVTAVDNNPMACAAAENNVRLNRCPEKVSVRQADLLQEPLPAGSFDLVIANLYRGLLHRLFSREDFWRSKTYLISGFTAAMEDELLADLPEGIKMVHREKREIWRLWVLEKAGKEC